ncbi:MAG: hypothetical protein QW577_04300 [Candidatus Bathyarchaeia archaeon]
MGLRSIDVAAIAIFSSMWAVLNLTVGPMGFTLFRLPIFCDFAVYFTLLLATWTVGRAGVPTAVGLVGALIVLALKPDSTQMIGFLASAILFDVLMSLCKHEVRLRLYNIVVAAIATVISAYFAGVVIGTVFMSRSLEWALTFWGVWHLIGGVISLVVATPIVAVLERAKVKGLN